MMLRKNRVAARVRAPAPRPVENVLSADARRKFADFIMLLDTAEKRSGVIKNERKKVKQSKIRDGPLSRGLFYLAYIYNLFFLVNWNTSFHFSRKFIKKKQGKTFLELARYHAGSFFLFIAALSL